MRLPSLARWLRTRNAAIASRRVASAARVKGVVGIEDQTPDCRWCGGAGYFLESRHRYRCLDCNPPVADEVAEPQPTYREQLIGEDIDIWDDARQKRRADR